MYAYLILKLCAPLRIIHLRNMLFLSVNLEKFIEIVTFHNIALGSTTEFGI